MSKLSFIPAGLVVALLAGAFVGNDQGAFAQQTGDRIEEIVVTAPAMYRREVSDSPTMKTEVVELTRRVTFGDLDLTKHAGVTELNARIEAVARDSCERLAEMFRLDEPGIRGVERCTEEAVQRAEEQVEEIVAAVN